MKYVLAAVTLCFLFSGSAAEEEQHHRPLCELGKMITNETWFAQTLYSVVHGNKRSLQCFTGCVIYTIDSIIGPHVKKLVGLPYSLFETCIRSGKQQHDTCKIVDCMKDAAVNGYHLMKGLGIHLPFQGLLERMPLFAPYHEYETRPEVYSSKPAPLVSTPKPEVSTAKPMPPKQEHKSGADAMNAVTGEADNPLCRLRDSILNGTFFSNTLGSAIVGNRRPLECYIGCALYAFDDFVGEGAKKVLGPIYLLYSHCIEKGVEARDTCKITDCFMRYVVIADHVVHDLHLPTAFLYNIEKLPMFQEYDKRLYRMPEQNKTTTVTTTAANMTTTTAATVRNMTTTTAATVRNMTTTTAATVRNMTTTAATVRNMTTTVINMTTVTATSATNLTATAGTTRTPGPTTRDVITTKQSTQHPPSAATSLVPSLWALHIIVPLIIKFAY